MQQDSATGTVRDGRERDRADRKVEFGAGMDTSDGGNGIHRGFSRSYREAREKFLEAAKDAGLGTRSLAHPLGGLHGEALAMDVVRDGPPDASAVLVVSSGCHGVEGYCGSGIQVAALRDAQWRARIRASGIALVHVHALNPWGFSWISRTTHENVDLNRNFHDFSRPLPVNREYRELHPLLVPGAWPPDPANAQAIADFVARHGHAAFQAAVSRGQHEYPDGMFFGGTGPTWSNLRLREVVRDEAGGARRIAWIDIHTGLGPAGVGERIHAGPDEPESLARARRWWGGDGRTPVTSIHDGSSTSARLTGMAWSAFVESCPDAEYTGIAMEYGTLPFARVTEALRADQWLRRHPQAPAELAGRLRAQVMDAFFTDAGEWRERVVAQAREAMFQAVDGLGG